jgi:Na+/proline symporter
LDNLQIVLLVAAGAAAVASTTTSLINMHPTSATHVFIRDIKKVGNKTAMKFQSQMSIIFAVKGRGL